MLQLVYPIISYINQIKVSFPRLLYIPGFLIIFNKPGTFILGIMINCISDKFIALENRFPITPYIYSLVGNSCIGLMQCATKLLGSYMSTNYILYLRASLLIIINTFVMIFMGGPVYIKKSSGNYIQIKLYFWLS